MNNANTKLLPSFPTKLKKSPAQGFLTVSLDRAKTRNCRKNVAEKNNAQYKTLRDDIKKYVFYIAD